MTTLQILETGSEWHAPDVADESRWIEFFDEAERDELDAALRRALEKSSQVLEISKNDFPLPTLQARLRMIERELIEGRGFVLLRGLERERYSREEIELIYWGIGMHLGAPWPQNQYGHVLGDVTDQGIDPADPTSRGNEIGKIAFPYHSDGSDLVGLLCLQKSRSGGTSTVANAVSIHNDLVREAPDLAAALYESQPYDFRGGEPEGAQPWYELPVFTNWNGRLFVRYIRPYILASQRYDTAPRIQEQAERAMQRMDEMTHDRDYNVFMDLEPGDMQFVNNYHVLHARTAYEDDREAGLVRHLKRLWLATDTLKDRPPYFQRNLSNHWEDARSVSKIVIQ
ncbi:MAG: TauD/TfdA family dioxygenase [Deltaproteobacteria bacterium]|nr:TauD/TfdA family dioxygenase [Deltaproteobacteria bacterium]MBW2391605.1 TauD/TfdA family dioxygenase [Deltaproteobacteria bacterium]MBW2725684.1 TauD/TfdA family dioxygenase [Deltaproteobacteria bacterium]